MGTVLDPRLAGLNAAFFTSPNYKGSTYQQYATNLLQNKIDRDAEYATDIFTIKEEQNFGNLDWSNGFTCRITHVLSDRQTGEKLGDDFRNIIFLDKNHFYNLGYRYYFNDNIFLTVNTDFYKFPTLSSTIRRCNNVLNNYDKYGALHLEPCIIDYQIRSTDFDFNKNIIVPDGYTTILVQGNEWTKTYYLNQRFMFGGQAWKCTFINNFQRINTLDDNSVNLIRMILMKDAIAPDDDIINNIPNTKTYNYTISIDQGNMLEQQVNYTSTLSATVKNGTEIVNSIELLWESSDSNICEIQPNGSFILKSEGTCNVTVSLKDNSSVSALLTINVVTLPVDNYEIRISPNINEILQGDSQTFDVALYHNNIRQSDIVTSIPSGVPSSYYKFTSASNGFTITNLKQYTSSPLVVVCSSGSYSKNISINLSGGW